MTTAIAAAPIARAGDTDNRATYLSFGLAYVFGHGAAAVSGGDDPLVRLPGWLPMTLLGLGLAAGTVFATLAAARAQRGGADVLSGRLPRPVLDRRLHGALPRHHRPDVHNGLAGPGHRALAHAAPASSSACSTWARAPCAATSCTTASAAGWPWSPPPRSPSARPGCSGSSPSPEAAATRSRPSSNTAGFAEGANR